MENIELNQESKNKFQELSHEAKIEIIIGNYQGEIKKLNSESKKISEMIDFYNSLLEEKNKQISSINLKIENEIKGIFANKNIDRKDTKTLSKIKTASRELVLKKSMPKIIKTNDFNELVFRNKKYSKFVDATMKLDVKIDYASLKKDLKIEEIVDQETGEVYEIVTNKEGERVDFACIEHSKEQIIIK